MKNPLITIFNYHFSDNIIAQCDSSNKKFSPKRGIEYYRNPSPIFGYPKANRGKNWSRAGPYRIRQKTHWNLWTQNKWNYAHSHNHHILDFTSHCYFKYFYDEHEDGVDWKLYQILFHTWSNVAYQYYYFYLF